MNVFLPWFGHFGDLIHDILPGIWALYRPGDVICGNPRHAALYPVTPDASLWPLVEAFYPNGYDHDHNHHALELQLEAAARERWPRALLLHHWDFSGGDERPLVPRPEPMPVDVVLAPRLKHYTDTKSGFPWARLSELCTAQGWTVGLAGSQRESLDVPASVRAWELDPPGDTVTGSMRLLTGARITVSLDSGIAHLAALLGVPQLVYYANRGDETAVLKVRDSVYVRMQFDALRRWNQFCWPVTGSPEDVVSDIHRLFRGEGLAATLTPATPEPTIPAPFPEPRYAGPELVEARLARCRICENWVDEKCSIAGCNCSGAGFASRLLSRCPLTRCTA